MMYSTFSLDENSMDYTEWPELLPNLASSQPPNPNRPTIDSYFSSPYGYGPQPQKPKPKPKPNSNPYPDLDLDPAITFSLFTFTREPAIRPPGFDSYASFQRAYLHGYGGTRDRNQTMEIDGYYSGPNARSWAVNEVSWQYGAGPAGYAGAGITIPPNGMQLMAIANPSSIILNNPTVQPCGNVSWKKQPKKTKIVQSAYCGVCNIDCNSKDVLYQHKLGKKHKRNLEKLLETAVSSSALAGSSNPVIGPQEKSRKKAESVEDLETKRKKIVEGGAAAEAVRACTICNVACNSETVFNYHLAGQRHAAMVKKYAAGTVVAAAT